MTNISYQRSKYSEAYITELAEKCMAGELNNRGLIDIGGETLMHLVWRKWNLLDNKRMRAEFKKHGRLL